MVTCNAYAASVGKKDINQDAYLCDPIKGIFGVFDGVGSSLNPHRASSMAVNIFQAAAKELGSMERQDQMVAPWLCKTLQTAHEAILPTGSATTASVMVICADGDESNLLTLNVGDSRIYGFKREKQRLVKLTVDDGAGSDSRLDDVESDRDMTKSLEVLFRFRNIITRAVGQERLGVLEPSVYPLENFDGFLLTTDGVHDNLSTREILEVLLNPSIEESQIANALVDTAYARSQGSKHLRKKPDDITAVYVTVQN